MKGTHSILSCLFLVGLLFTYFVPPSMASCDSTLTMAYPGWSRTSISVHEETDYRLDHELLEGIMATAGCDFNQVTLPFKRILEGVRHGVFDGTVAVSKNTERADYAWFSMPYRPEIIAMFMRADDIEKQTITKISDLLQTKGKINIGLGTWHGAALDKLIKEHPEFKNRLIYIDDAPMMHRTLSRNRVSMVIGDLHYSNHILNSIGLAGRIKAHPFHISIEDVHLVFSKKTVSKDQVAIINQAIIEFRATDAYKAILNRYSSQD